MEPLDGQRANQRQVARPIMAQGKYIKHHTLTRESISLCRMTDAARLSSSGEPTAAAHKTQGAREWILLWAHKSCCPTGGAARSFVWLAFVCLCPAKER